MSVTVNMRGLAALNQRLSQLSKEQATKAAQSANRAGAAVLLKAAKATAPVSSVPEGAQIKRNNKGGTTRMETHYKIVNALKVRKTKPVTSTQVQNTVTAGKAYHAALVEFGSIHNAPNPFMRNAFENNQQAIIDAMSKMLNRQLVRRGV